MYEFTPADPTIKRPGHDSQASEKRTILFIYIPMVGFASIIVTLIAGNSQIADVANVILGIALNVLALLWAKVDADERQYQLSRFFTLAVVLFGVFAIVYYLFRSRGAAGGVISTGWMILYGLTLTLTLSLIGGIITLVLVTAGILPKNVLDA